MEISLNCRATIESIWKFQRVWTCLKNIQFTGSHLQAFLFISWHKNHIFLLPLFTYFLFCTATLHTPSLQMKHATTKNQIPTSHVSKQSILKHPWHHRCSISSPFQHASISTLPLEFSKVHISSITQRTSSNIEFLFYLCRNVRLIFSLPWQSRRVACQLAKCALARNREQEGTV